MQLYKYRGIDRQDLKANFFSFARSLSRNDLWRSWKMKFYNDSHIHELKQHFFQLERCKTNDEASSMFSLKCEIVGRFDMEKKREKNMSNDATIQTLNSRKKLDSTVDTSEISTYLSA